MAISSLTSFLLGSWGCRYRELQPIAFGGHGSGGANTTSGITNGEGGAEQGDEEQGFITGLRGAGGRTKRGSRGDLGGGGDYEMVTMMSGGSGSGKGHGHGRSQSTVSQAGGPGGLGGGGPLEKAD